MDAVKFIKERDRMCKSFDNCSCGLRICPAWGGSCKLEPGTDLECEADKQVEIVKDWAAAHPRKMMVSDEALKKLQEQIAAWPMERRFVVQQLIRDYLRNREDLRAYEATGLTAEDIDMDQEAAEQLRRLCRDCDLDRLEELAEANKDGRLVVLPCKVGDIVWANLDGMRHTRKCVIEKVIGTKTMNLWGFHAERGFGNGQTD